MLFRSLGHANLGLTLLRQGRYDEAEAEIRRAKDLDASDPEIRLLLAKTFEITDRRDEALGELRDGLGVAPDYAKLLYAVAELLVGDASAEALDERADVLRRLVERSPANVPARLQLVEVTLQRGEATQPCLGSRRRGAGRHRYTNHAAQAATPRGAAGGHVLCPTRLADTARCRPSPSLS